MATASDHEGNNHNNSSGSNPLSSMMMTMSGSGGGSTTHGNQPNVIVRGTIAYCLRIRTLADALPSVLQPLVSNGKLSIVFFVGGQLSMFALWLPFWCLSFALSEMGVYLGVLGFIVLAGRGVLRMIAFPGSSHRVAGEIEKEFAKYSVRVLTSSATSWIELAQALASHHSNSNMYEIASLWKRAKSYRDRVLGVYAVVLKTTLGDGNSDALPAASVGDLNEYGNNVLTSSDIGNLSGLTPEAIADGRILLNHLEGVLTLACTLEHQANAVLEQQQQPSAMHLSEAAKQTSSALVASAQELLNFVESLKPPGAVGDPNDDEALSNAELRRRLEEEQQNNAANASLTDTIRMGLASILPMLDPPLHGSIFGMDVLRGCVLSRYKGARQLWVPRPSGGKIDCLHIPAKMPLTSVVPTGGRTSQNSKAVLYCNPNAGLIEVATGMSLAGGNVASEIDNVVNDNCWTDFYTNAGFDIYLYNYAGFGRSYGSSFCELCSNAPGGSHTPGVWGRIKRIFYGLFFGFSPTPDSLRADGQAVASHILSHAPVESLVIHGESIGGMAASGTARKLTENMPTRSKVSLLLCDRTFCNLEAVAQRLVGGWSGYAIRLLAPFWSTDVVGDFLAASCPKVVATDSADAIIADSSSLKAGISFWKEIQRSASSTKGIGWITDAPLHYRMADWENVSVEGSRYVPQPRATRMTPPVWPADKHVSIDEAFHFAACARRIGKLASLEKKRFAASLMPSGGDTTVGTAAVTADSCRAPVYQVWKYLGCCEGLCGSPLGVSVKGGFDTTVSWLSSMCVFGGQTVVEGIEHRRNWSDEDASTKLHELGDAEASDFDCRPPGYEQQESDAVVHPKPIPEVLQALKQIVVDHSGDDILNSVSHEVSFVIGTLEYVFLRLSAPTSLESSWKSRHLTSNGSMKEGSFMNLHCGHNNPYSAEERKRLRAVLLQATRTPLPAVV